MYIKSQNIGNKLTPLKSYIYAYWNSKTGNHFPKSDLGLDFSHFDFFILVLRHNMK